MPARLTLAVGLPTLSHRISLGKSDLLRHWAAGGALVLVLATVVLAAAAILRSRRNARHVALLCALAALANGLAWSLIVPPFQVPDENAHYAYVQQVAERGTLPRTVLPEGPLSPREDTMLGALGTFAIAEHRHVRAPETELQQRAIERVAAEHLSARGSGDALTATNNPPLYYALQAIPYKLTPGGRVLDKLAAMRALSALMGAITVALVFMFLCELLPGAPWAWPAGALAAALQPLFGFMSGGVNNDDLLYLTAAGLLWAVARAFRRGLAPRGGALIGGFLGAGLVAKLTLLGFVPAAALAVALLGRRAWSLDRRGAVRGVAWAVGLSAAPIAVYTVLNHVVWSRGLIPGGVGSVAPAGGRSFNTGEELSHIWQLFLPPLWMHRQFAYLPLWDTWFKGLFGRFGWLDYGFPSSFYKGALAVSLLVCGLAAAELVRGRVAVRRRAGELAVYALAAVGLCVEIGVQSYRYLVITGGVFQQARYLLPLLGLYAALAALAVRYGGRRWGPALCVGLVALAIGHDLYAQAITISRYYG
jgi:4-amino-4-deoxy-L-arabinose transferase-like glycosyltransferase